MLETVFSHLKQTRHLPCTCVINLCAFLCRPLKNNFFSYFPYICLYFSTRAKISKTVLNTNFHLWTSFTDENIGHQHHDSLLLRLLLFISYFILLIIAFYFIGLFTWEYLSAVWCSSSAENDEGKRYDLYIGIINRLHEILFPEGRTHKVRLSVP